MEGIGWEVFKYLGGQTDRNCHYAITYEYLRSAVFEILMCLKHLLRS